MSAIVATNVVVGLLVAPRRTIDALRAPTGSSLFTLDVSYDALNEMTVGELRAMLGIPPHGLTQRERRLHAHAPPR